MESLSGNFLISTPQMPDPRFQEQVIYLCAHSDEGAMGLVVNNPNTMVTLLDILHSTNLPIPDKSLPPVYIGGPVEMDSGFILYSSDYSSAHELIVCPEISLSRDMKLLEDIALGKGPEKFLFLLGYAGWGAGQLEMELMDNSWLTVPGDYDVLFNIPDELKWKQAAGNFGVNISMFGDVMGTA